MPHSRDCAPRCLCDCLKPLRLRLLLGVAASCVLGIGGCTIASPTPTKSAPTLATTPQSGGTTSLLSPTPTPKSTPRHGTFTLSGSMVSNYGGSGYLMADGTVLLLGFEGQSELYDPRTGTFTAVAQPTVPGGGIAYPLANGKVLVLDQADTDASIFDPSTGSIAATGSPGVDLRLSTGTSLSDGRLLFTGGADLNGRYFSSAEIYDPATGKFSPTGSMKTPREFNSATLLLNGEVLIAGGDRGDTGPNPVILSSAELYNPTTGRFTATGSLGSARTGFNDVRLGDGRVLILGGEGADEQVLASAEIYDPATGKFSPTGSMSIAREGFVSVLLPDGDVLVAGGSETGVDYLSSAEIYDPANGRFTPAASMTEPRNVPGAILLSNGSVLIYGGQNSTGNLSSAELYWQ